MKRLSSQFSNLKTDEMKVSYKEGAASVVDDKDEEDWRVEHGRKCEVFNRWCRENGVIMPKLEYPAYFEGRLVGMRAT